MANERYTVKATFHRKVFCDKLPDSFPFIVEEKTKSIDDARVYVDILKQDYSSVVIIDNATKKTIQ
jgi:hypothetical protein